ncbi:hypothetical protein G6F23_012718 [Rhizopus arrhizus]|nr:hypothetical protein G6F23_012718 [Rhizopus arrhizus]
MLWPQFVVGIFLAPTHVGHHQAVVTDPRALDMDAAGATQAQLQHAIGADIEIFDADLHAIRRRRRRCAHFLAVENQADAKALATAAAVADQIQIASLAHAQAHRCTRHQRAGGEEAARCAVEATVGHEHHMVTTACMGLQLCQQCIGIGYRVRLAAYRGDHRGSVPGQLRAVQEHHFIGQCQRRRQRLCMCTQPHRVAARLHRDHDACIADLGTQAFQRGGDRRRVMGEVVVDGDAINAADHFHAALDAAEPRQRRDHISRRHAYRMRGRQRGQAVEHIVPAPQRPDRMRVV